MKFCLDIKEVSHRFQGKIILDNISLSRNTAGINVIVGKNGVGKTVLLRLLAGIYSPQQGKILLHNASEYLQTQDHLTRRYIGYQNEDFCYWREYQVKELFQRVAQIKGVKNLDYCDKMIEQFHLKKVFLKTLKNLSLGYQRRISLALSTLGNPQILVLDEPSNGLDPSETDFFFQWLPSIAKHCYIFLSSNRLQEIEDLQLSIQIILLAQTHLKYDGPMPNNLREWYRTNHENL